MAGLRLLIPILALTATPAAAADRAHELTELAGVLGESQALRELCEGGRDQYWRSRMMRLLSVEQAEGAAAAAMSNAFSGAYAAARAEHLECGPDSRRAEAQAAARGQQLAAELAAPTPPPPADPGAIAEPREPR